MGIAVSKGKPYLGDFNQLAGNLRYCPDQFCNYNQIGMVYLIQHKINSAPAAKCAHLSVYIDIAGESISNERLAGIHAHVVVFDLKTIKTNLLYNYESNNWNDYDDVHLVGQLDSDWILMHGTPVLYAMNLQQWLHQCPGLPWPQQYLVAGDVAPQVVNIYVKGKQSTANTNDKFQ